MIKLVPVMTEKSMRQVKEGAFTFYVPLNLDKLQIRNLIEKNFGVHVVKIKTINLKARTKKNNRGQMQRIKAVKKAIVILKTGEKIELFEEEKKPKKAKKTKKGNKE